MLAQPHEQALHDQGVERRAVFAACGVRHERGGHFIAMSIALRTREHFIAARTTAGAKLDEFLREEREVFGALFDGHRFERRKILRRFDVRFREDRDWAGVADEPGVFVVVCLHDRQGCGLGD